MAQSSAERSALGALSGPEMRINDALTDMHAYRLVLEGDWERLGRQLDNLARAGGSPDECSTLLTRRAEIGEELEAFRQTTAALREDTIGPPPTPRAELLGRRARARLRPGRDEPPGPPPGSGSAPEA